MKYLSVCSGIEAATVAWHPLGFLPVAFSEIESFPCAVLQHHYPKVPNLGDMTKFKDWPDYAIDILVGGTPCQSFSVAGLRKGLADPRGNLCLTFLAIIERYRPRWVVWENVPGVHSSWSDEAVRAETEATGEMESRVRRLALEAGLDGETIGDCGGFEEAHQSNDFDCFLAGLEELGYGVASTILDAQFFGVAQRRERVFVVGHIGGQWQRAAAVLFERACLCGNPAPSRETGQRVALPIGTRVDRHREAEGNNLIAPSLQAQGQSSHRLDSEAFVPDVLPIHDTATRYAGTDGSGNQNGKGHGLGIGGPHDPMFTLKADGFDASEDGTGRGTPLWPVEVAPTLNAHFGDKQGLEDQHVNSGAGMFVPALNTLQPSGVRHRYGNASQTNAGTILSSLRKEIGAQAFTQWGLGILDSLQATEVLRQTVHGKGIRLPAFTRCWMVHCALSREEDRGEGAVHSVREAQCSGCSSPRWEPSEQHAIELGTYLSELSQPGPQAERFMHDLWQADEGPWLLRETLSAFQEIRRPSHVQTEPAQPTCAVRRLVPEECEFLQGFPRGYTRIPYGKKAASDCPDGPRYKALGNSMAVPCMAWIGRRIVEVETIP